MSSPHSLRIRQLISKRETADQILDAAYLHAHNNPDDREAQVAWDTALLALTSIETAIVEQRRKEGV
jgi:hypothetical protein